MSVLKRGFISMCRQPLKSGIFFLLIILLSSVASGAILIKQAIVNTDQNLRLRMPAISTVMQDAESVYEQTGEWPEREILTPDIIRQIGELPQVRAFDYSIDISWGVYGFGLNLWENPDFFFQLGWEYDEDLGVRLRIEGINYPDFFKTRDQFIELVRGRSFYEEELIVNREPYPALISSSFAETNEFNIGTSFDVQVVVFDYAVTEDEEIGIERRDQPPLVEVTFPLEVIGIFEPIAPTLPENADTDTLFQADRWQSMMQYRIYVPNIVAEMMFNARAEGLINPDEIFFQNFFLLENPLYFEAFASEIENLPGSWRAADFSSGFRDISTSMENMKSITNLVFFVAIGAILLIVTLLILLFLHDRKQELGIYLALGETKRNVMMQMIVEIIPLVIVGMTFALIIGSIVASGLSREMLRQQMVQKQSEFLVSEEMNQLEYLGYRFELTHDEMLKNYEVKLGARFIILFYIAGLVTILLATIIPIGFMIHMKPKKILL